MIKEVHFIYVVLASIVAIITIYIAAKKSFLVAMKGQFIELAEKELLMTKLECPIKQNECSTAICTKINELKSDITLSQRDMQEIKNKVNGNLVQMKENIMLVKKNTDENLAEVKNKINGVKQDVKALETSMQKELKEITRFIGSVEQYMKKEK